MHCTTEVYVVLGAPILFGGMDSTLGYFLLPFSIVNICNFSTCYFAKHSKAS